MKSSRTVAERQNDPEAIALIRASYHCMRNEQIIKYFMITLSIAVCIAAIINRYLNLIFVGVEDIARRQEQISIYLNLASGVIIVLGIVLGFYTSRMHAESTVLRDRYDAYVFDNPPNLSILRPISDTYVELYSKKVRKKESEFANYIYGDEPVGDEKIAQYEYIKEEAHSDYQLYLSIQPFFLAIWIGFVVLIIIIAASFNDKFVMTLINIMIPSLSAINMIGNSWYSCKLQMRQLTVLINLIDKIDSMPDEQRLEYITDSDNVRLLADGLFNYRSSAFMIPNFLVKRHHKEILKSRQETHLREGYPAVTETAAADAAAQPEPVKTAKRAEKPAGKSAQPAVKQTEKKEKAQPADVKREAKAVKQTENQPSKSQPAAAKQAEKAQPADVKHEAKTANNPAKQSGKSAAKAQPAAAKNVEKPAVKPAVKAAESKKSSQPARPDENKQPKRQKKK